MGPKLTDQVRKKEWKVDHAPLPRACPPKGRARAGRGKQKWAGQRSRLQDEPGLSILHPEVARLWTLSLNVINKHEKETRQI